MAIRVALNHKTEYRYDRLVNLGPQIVRLRPAPHCRTPVLSYSVRVTPQEHFQNWQQDPHSNYLLRLVFPEKARSFCVEVDLVAELTVINPFDFFLEPSAENFPFDYEPWLTRELAPFRETLPSTPRLEKFLASVDRKPRHVVDFLVDLNQRLQKEISYVIRLEPGVQTPEETLQKGKGSCRDSAWLLVQLLRRLGFAARFVSGYLIQLVSDQKPLDGPEGPTADFTDLHAWTEVYLPGAGWVGLDPTSGLFAGEGHLPLAATPDPQSAAPITGAVDKCECQFDFSMTVRRIHEDPRVTKPYTEEEWKNIEALGHQVDHQLRAGNVRLTAGGEPTFVSIDDMDGDEWNTEAVGPNKRRLAGELITRLRTRFAPGGLLHYGQGKWYPGEQLPRWALGCYWRKDGQPIWRDMDLVAKDGLAYEVSEQLAAEFIRHVAQRLRVNPDHAQAGFEDTWYYLWKERRLPANVDPFDSHLRDERERTRLAKIFEQGLDKVIGYALPLRRTIYGFGNAWESGAWFFRPERMYLIPGDSPMGFRLPLDSIPWSVEKPGEAIEGVDPASITGELPAWDLPWPEETAGEPAESPGGAPQLVGRRLEPGEGGQEQWQPQQLPLRGEQAPWIIRTALVVEPREGILHVFMPPVRRAEDYLELIGHIEAAAAHFRVPVRVEGYTPPFDPRIESLKVTPDPGVIEVNIPPAGDWDEQVRITRGVYEDARASRLGTEKFMLDGRHTGTGGGNHIVLGGATPQESPFLRRPDLLRSLIAYWVNHPALSYIFSGLFIGPTSQAPRVDEARHDQIHEMEIAFQQIPQPGGSIPPWLVDRVLRHLLVDVSGNTHRAEFCIDKLFSPDGPAGRLGLVEFRAFEMPPHYRMSLAQGLLLRALIARFWREPYSEKLVRWGTQLHDRFMLPYFVWMDLEDVIAEMNAAGYPLQAQWFAPHFEFRFPSFGTVVYRGVELEIRQAIEPWHVLGEEGAVGGTVRYVDSSVERLQVLVRGMVDDRHVVACNGAAVPLHPTGNQAEFVAGVRFRAWQPASCLHPTIGAHAPLIFDVYDAWSKRSIGGCTYHVAHPGGRNYTTFPVNANEAEARRHARFYHFGHTPGPMAEPRSVPNPDFPFTLDLRRAV